MAKDYWGRISAENDKEFEKVLDELYLQYHYHQPNTPHYDTTPKEDGDTAYNDAH